MLNLIKKNSQLILGFIFFFTALFFFNKQIDLYLYLIAYAFVARKVVLKAIKNILKGQMLDENFLMAIASIVAFLIGEYAEGVAVMLFYAVGGLTEEYALNRSKSNISQLLNLKPEFANIKVNNVIKRVLPSAVNKGDVIVVKPGEKIPLDGLIVRGNTTVDASMLTGESLPVNRGIDEEVFSGTVNIDGVIEVRVTEIFENSTVAKIMQMVQQASENKAQTEKFITKFAKVYTPLVVILAALIALVRHY
jgi:Cd2+/Zn2+-exporting ATPase